MATVEGTVTSASGTTATAGADPRPSTTPTTSCCSSTAASSRPTGSKTGTSSFLVDTLRRRLVGSPALEDMVGTDELLSKFDVDDIGTEALLFQTGYLTIGDERNLGGKTLYRLRYPNREVKQERSRRANARHDLRGTTRVPSQPAPFADGAFALPRRK